MTGFSTENPANEWLFYTYRAFRAKFLAAITADAPVIFIGRRIILIPIMPVDRFGVYWAHVHANTAFDATLGHNIGSGRNRILDKLYATALFKRFFRFSIDIKIQRDKFFDRIPQEFNFFFQVSSCPHLHPRLICQNQGRIKIHQSAFCRIKCDGIGTLSFTGTGKRRLCR